jgi:hypothetical protein
VVNFPDFHRVAVMAVVEVGWEARQLLVGLAGKGAITGMVLVGFWGLAVLVASTAAAITAAVAVAAATTAVAVVAWDGVALEMAAAGEVVDRVLWVL